MLASMPLWSSRSTTFDISLSCPLCPSLPSKPLGCDGQTRCGNSVGGADILPYTYDYDEENTKFQIKKRTEKGSYETRSFSLRRQFSKMVATVTRSYYGYYDDNSGGGAVQSLGLEKGCGRAIEWQSMVPLTKEEPVSISTSI